MQIQNTRENLQATSADHSRSEFDNINLQDARFNNVKFLGATFSNLNPMDVETDACDTTGMKFRGALVADVFDAYRNKT